MAQQRSHGQARPNISNFKKKSWRIRHTPLQWAHSQRSVGSRLESVTVFSLTPTLGVKAGCPCPWKAKPGSCVLMAFSYLTDSLRNDVPRWPLRHRHTHKHGYMTINEEQCRRTGLWVLKKFLEYLINLVSWYFPFFPAGKRVIDIKNLHLSSKSSLNEYKINSKQ